MGLRKRIAMPLMLFLALAAAFCLWFDFNSYENRTRTIPCADEGIIFSITTFNGDSETTPFVKCLGHTWLSIDNQSGVSNSGEIILNVADDMTYILDAMTGLPVALEDVKDGDTIYAYIGPAMTMSLPPMTNAVMIFTNLPADAKAPDYVEVKSMVTDAGTSKSVLTAADGTEFTLAEDCNIFPYLTRNIVTLDDLTQGKKCVVWSDDENTASKIMLFAE